MNGKENVQVCHDDYSPTTTLHKQTHLFQHSADPESGDVGRKTSVCHPSCTRSDWPHCGALCAADCRAAGTHEFMDFHFYVLYETYTEM